MPVAELSGLPFGKLTVDELRLKVDGPWPLSAAPSRLADCTRCRFTTLGFSFGAPDTRLGGTWPLRLSKDPYVVWGPLPCNAVPAVTGESGRNGGVPNRGGLLPNVL